ncbi:MAG: phenylalanine--tRNA ligase subunit alpha [Candidatus Aenigmarchaeota archaeon]|nr:phenylalanine--tRNA ligase subunit alpha [Candidatus Aenigmarchaeota archaeon]
MVYELTEEGRNYIKKGLPEMQLLKMAKKNVDISTVKNEIDNFAIAMQWAKKNGWAKIASGKIEILSRPEKYPIYESLKKVEKGNTDENIEMLVSRNLVVLKREDAKTKAEKLLMNDVGDLTSDLIITGLWKKAKFKKYNVEISGEKINIGKRHILSLYIEKIREIFLDMGFTEAAGPLVESSFWNFDALYQPQDHPARDLADTFYMKIPENARLASKGIVNAVKSVHENGGNTGSTGWGYKWSEDFAKKCILRTHTTSVSARSLSKINSPAKIFCVGRVFRNETIDYKHLPEFTQVEGIVVDENVCFRDLLGYLKEFYKRMGFQKIRFRPAYFPYTEMSVEPEVYFEDKKEWMELGGAGIFRPEVTQPLGIKSPVLAWGLGLERPIFLKIGLNDIRYFYYKNDLKMLREMKTWLQ